MTQNNVHAHIPHPLWRVTVTSQAPLSGTLSEKISEALEEACVSVFLHNQEATDGDSWTITLTTYGPPDLDDIFARIEGVENAAGIFRREDLAAEKLPEVDWLRHVHENFPPITAGRFFIYGSHYEGALPGNLLALQIDAATAFGSGEHETTKSCLLAFETLLETHAFKNTLDMGCGSGILGIAAAKLCPDIRVTAVDIDPESIIVTGRHADMNGVGDMVETQIGDGYAAPIVAQNGPYDLIFANILAGPLVEMAPDLASHLAPGGICILSGLLLRQKEQVTTAHTSQGLTRLFANDIGDWSALVLQKPQGRV
jgi:ribosomal protein L11 methyltransferase